MIEIRKSDTGKKLWSLLEQRWCAIVAVESKEDGRDYYELVDLDNGDRISHEGKRYPSEKISSYYWQEITPTNFPKIRQRPIIAKSIEKRLVFYRDANKVIHETWIYYESREAFEKDNPDAIFGGFVMDKPPSLETMEVEDI